jgi:hypothetical protein
MDEHAERYENTVNFRMAVARDLVTFVEFDDQNEAMEVCCVVWVWQQHVLSLLYQRGLSSQHFGYSLFYAAQWMGEIVDMSNMPCYGERVLTATEGVIRLQRSHWEDNCLVHLEGPAGSNVWMTVRVVDVDG